MTKTLAFAALAFSLVACASEEAGAPSSEPPAAPKPDASVATTLGGPTATPGAPLAPCHGVTSTTAADAGAGAMRVAPSPIERCEGRYSGRSASGAGSIGAEWLRMTPEGCMWGLEYVLLPDSSVLAAGSGNKLGTWSGDAFYFKLTDSSVSATGHTYVFQLLAEADRTE